MLITLAISILVGLPALMIYSLCVSASFADGREEISLQQENIQLPLVPVDGNTSHI